MVLGMHRSGTSAYTRIFGLLGADLPKNLLPPSPTNEAGYWESRELMEIHEQVLSSGGSNWHDWRAFNPDWFNSPASGPFRQRILDVLRRDFASSPLFAIKDPRICRLWPLWRDVLTEFGAKPLIIMPVRNPLEVAASLKRRNGINPAKSHLLWLRHVLEAESATRGIPRAIASYDSLVEDWQDVVTRLTRQLGLSWPRRGAMVDIEIEQYLSTEFKHHHVTPEQLAGKPEVVDWVKEAHAALMHMAEDAENPTDMARLDRIRVPFDKASAAFGVALATGEMEIARKDEDVQRLSSDLSALRETAAQRERELGEQFSAFKTISENLSGQRDQLAAALEEGKAAAARNSAQAALLGQELEALRNAVREHEAAATKLRADLDGAQSLSNDRERERDQLAAALEEEKGAAARNNAQAALLGQELEALRNAVREHEAAVTKLRADLGSAQSLSNDRERQRDQLAAALEAEKAAVARAAEQVATAKADLRTRDGEVGRLARELEAARLYLRDSQAEVQRLAGELDGARTEVARAAAERQNFSEALATASGERDRLAAALEEEKGALAQANEQAAALGREAEGLHGVIWEYEATATEFLADLEAMQVLARERESERDQFAAALEKARLEAEWRGERLSDLSRELRAAAVEAERAGHLEAALAAVQQDNDRREQLVIELSQKLEAKSSERSRLAGERDGALQAAAAHAARIRELEGHLEAETGEKKRLAAELARTTEQIRRVENNAAAREAVHTAALAESEARAQAQIGALGEQLVDAEAALAKGRAERNRSPWKRILSPSQKRRLGRQLVRSGLFDAAWYVREYPEAAKNGRAPVAHYLEEGYLRGFRPNPLFDSRWYLERYEDVRRAGVNPLVHYLQNGFREGRDPGPAFQTAFYLEANPDVRSDGMNPLAHYLRYGRHEGRLPVRRA